ncbi:hypothetical protein GW17_00005382 [Ensete ventricosum]|nr:hypothetical protein GW17_00005382 [Ensete ventricosum]
MRGVEEGPPAYLHERFLYCLGRQKPYKVLPLGITCRGRTEGATTTEVEDAARAELLEWSIMASRLPGRTDNDIKNYWNTKLKKKLLGITPFQRKPHRQSYHHQNQHFSPSSSSQGAGSESFPITSQVIMPRSTPVISSDLFRVPYHQYQMKSCSSMNTVSIDQSCISSEENCTRFSNIKYLNYDYGGGEEQMGIQKESKLFLLGGGCQVETGLEYSLEEIKQLLISNSVCNNNDHNLYLDLLIANGKMENSKLQHAPDF